MEFRIEIGIEQLLAMVKQLPERDVEQLLSRIQSEMNRKQDKPTLSELLLSAPTWSDNDEKDFQDARDHLNMWRRA